MFSFDLGSLITTIFGVIFGAVITRIFYYHDEKNRRKEEENKRKSEENKRKEKEDKRNEEEIKHKVNIKNLIKAECELNLENLKKYDEKYLKLKISSLSPSKNNNEVFLNFYKNLNSFPIFTHDAWYNSLNIVSEIFNDDKIKRINEFNVKCDMLKEKSIVLHKKLENDSFVNGILANEYSVEINEAHGDIDNFEWEINRLIGNGEAILNFFSFL